MNTMFFAVLLYFLLAFTIAVLSYKRQLNSNSFIIGNRSLNYWLTALAAHASDMSNWLFMGYPAMIFMGGLFNAWIAVGLVLCMLLNWQLVAPKLRILTEKAECLTISGFFEKCLKDSSGVLGIFSAGICTVFYTVYISAGLIGLGYLAQSLFGISYELGILLGAVVIVLYVLIGGFTTLAWLDLFQGIFLMSVILFVPIYLLPKLGGVESIYSIMKIKGLSTSLFPTFNSVTLLKILTMTLGWGLGYFGQPHIITKFMAIKNVAEIKKSKRIGLLWMVFSLLGATLVGIVGIGFFLEGVYNPEMIFIEMVQKSFHPLLIGFILCAVIAAIVNVVSSQMLILSAVVSEDLYKRFSVWGFSEKRQLIVSRLSIICTALIALGIAYLKPSSIYSLVLYAWSGLGAAFGPLLLHILYSKKITKRGAWVGILSGGILSAIWPSFNAYFPFSIDPLLPSFSISFISIWLVSRMTYLEKDVALT